jgi:hypothetical protein
MRLRPVKGEGERSKSLLKKGPLLIATALFIGYPVCIAQAVTTSSALGLPIQQQGQIQKPIQLQTQPKNYLSLRSIASLPSNQEISTLESTLNSYKAQLKTLKSSTPLDPSFSAEIAQKVQILETKIQSLETKIQRLKDSLVSLQLAKDTLSSAIATLDVAIATESAALTKYNTAKAKHDQDLSTFTEASSALSKAESALQTATSDASKALDVYNTASANKSAAQNTLNQTQQTLNEAQNKYDTELIPDPTWTAPTYQKEHIRVFPETIIVVEVTTTTQQSENILPPLDHTTWSGAGTGAQGSQPTINQGVVKFSYMMQGVTSTGQVNSPANEPFTLSVDVKNMDANRGIQDTYKIELFTYNVQGQQNGYAIFNSPQGWHDWTTRTISTTPTSDVASYKVVLSAIDGGFWWGTYGPEMKNPTLSATTTTTTITYREETIYRYETYYTTEPVLVEETINVSINEGGSQTFTVPEGGVFVSSSLRYEAKDRPQCGVNIDPNVQGKTQVTIAASNGVWGDPCGGWYKHVTGTITYQVIPTAPLIHDPALLPPLQQAQLQQTQAQENFDAALQTSNEAEESFTIANFQLSSAQSSYNTELEKSQAATTSNEAAKKDVDDLTLSKVSAQNSLNNATGLLDLATSNEVNAQNLENQALKNQQDSESILIKTSNEEQKATQATEGSSTSYEASLEVAEASSQEIPALLTEAIDIFNTPQGSPDIPTNLDASNLQEIDLTEINPAELTEEQADLLKEAALETFETATEGSPEYEQALDALFLAAQQDDIQVDPSIASIPGVGQAAEALIGAINLIGNVGADIAPKARKKAQEVVVTTLIVGQIAQTAAIASAASGGSFRRR